MKYVMTWIPQQEQNTIYKNADVLYVAFISALM